MTNDERNPNSEIRITESLHSVPSQSSFVIRASVFFRASSLVILHLSDSPIPLQEKHCQRFQRKGLAAENVQSLKSAMGEILGDLLRLLHPEDGRIGRLLRLGVFARRLAQSLAGLRNVENVIDDLKRQSDMVAEVCQRLEPPACAVRAHPAQPRRAAEQRRRLAFVNIFQLSGGNFFAFALKVGNLAG